MAYINPTPGSATQQVVLKVWEAATEGTVDATNKTDALTIPALQDITINQAIDVFTWSQLDAGSKKQIPTTATNSIEGNLVVDRATFFGTAVAGTYGGSLGDTAIAQGVFGLARNKQLVNFEFKFAEDGANDVYVVGQGYLTNAAPALSSEAPVWVSPFTITVTGNFTVQNAVVS